MIRWEIPRLAKKVSFWSCGLQGEARDLETERPRTAEGQVKKKKMKKRQKTLHLYHFKKSAVCKPVSCVSGVRKGA